MKTVSAGSFQEFTRPTDPHFLPNTRRLQKAAITGSIGGGKQLQYRVAVQIAAFAFVPAAIFERAGGKPALADHDSVRNTDQFEIGEHRARPQSAIVQCSFDAA